MYYTRNSTGLEFERARVARRVMSPLPPVPVMLKGRGGCGLWCRLYMRQTWSGVPPSVEMPRLRDWLNRDPVNVSVAAAGPPRVAVAGVRLGR